jgi:hypothetical protein
VTTNQEASLSSFAASKFRLIALLLVGLSTGTINAQRQLRGLVLEDDRYNALPLSVDYSHKASLPSKFSLTSFLPKIVNQSTTNSAVAWSVAWYGFGALDARSRNLHRDSITHLSPLAAAFVYRQAQKHPGCSEPASLIDALEALKVTGAPRFSSFIEYCAPLTIELPSSVSMHRLDGYVRLFNSFDPMEIKVHSIKKAIAAGSPVVAGIVCPPSFQFATDFWQPREKALREYGGHAVTIAGYDDGMFGGAFHVANCWGRGWGSNGMTWIRYEDVADYVIYGFQLLEVSQPLQPGIAFFNEDGTPMKLTGSGGNYRFSKSYKTGDKFRIEVQSEKPLFLRALFIDPSGQRADIFPESAAIHPLVGRELNLPENLGFYPLTEPAGKNVIVIACSTSEIALKDFDPARSTGLNTPGSGQEMDKLVLESTQGLLVARIVLDQLR